MEILYNGADIVDLVDESRLEIDMSLGDRADTIYLCFKRGDGSADKWGYAPGDTLRVKEGALDTGKMAVNMVRFIDEEIQITAASIPDTSENKKKEWSSISFKTLCAELSKKMGFKAEFYGVDKDQTYKKVVQEDKDDLRFLSERCTYEGCVLMAYDGTIRIVSEEYIEGLKATTYRLEADDTTSKTIVVPPYGSCTVTDKDEKTKGTYTLDDKGKKLGFSFDFELSSIDEARRFAQNLLLKKNRTCSTGVIWSTDLYLDLSAGNKFTVNCGAFDDKLALITRIRHDLIAESTKIWFRTLGE